MAYPNAAFAYQPLHPDASFDYQPSQFFTEHDADAIDTAPSASDAMHEPGVTHVRKGGTYVTTHGILSPTTPHHPHHWTGQYAGTLSTEPGSMPYHYHDEHHAFSHDPAHQVPHPFGHLTHHATTVYERNPAFRPTASRIDFDQAPLAPVFDGAHYTHARSDSARGSFSQASQPPMLETSEDTGVPPTQLQTPLSPHTHEEWMGLHGMQTKNSAQSRRMRGPTPSRTTIELQRASGVRKKNARIDIPNERNIGAIEKLLETENDEDTIKELKQQKRLLRNREAALASRQRKKKHTEELEVQQKNHNQTIESLQAHSYNLEAQNDQMRHSNHHLTQQLSEAQRIIDALEEEKREMAMRHTEETSNLRKRLNAFTEQARAEYVAPAMSAVASSTGFTDFNTEMGALNMDASNWDNMLLGGDMHNESLDTIDFDSSMGSVAQPLPPAMTGNASTTAAVQPAAASASSETNVTSGLLFFLLLCGAFVASRPPNSHIPDLPRVPADVRAAAPQVLNNLLSENHPTLTRQTRASENLEPRPSGAPIAPLNNPRHSRLDGLHQHLTNPTRHQQLDAAFALTPSQYASITNINDAFPHNADFVESPTTAPTAPQRRRPLAETLAPSNVQNEQGQLPPQAGVGASKAEVYTRSLLWDRIPAEVVKQFRELVRATNALEAREARRNDDGNDDE